MIENSETNLVAAAVRGDAESFSRLCGQHYAALVAIAYSQLADRGLAEDAAQEALLIAYRDIARLKRADRFLPWLAAICRNTAADMARSRARERQVQIENCGDVPATSPNERDVVAATRAIIFRLRPELRDIILLRYYNEMSYQQIGGLLGISEEAVNGKLRRARMMIREQLPKCESMETEP